MRPIVRASLLPLLAAAVVLAAPPARAAGGGGGIGATPWSTGVLLGASVLSVNGVAGGAFALELPVEYSVKVGPGYLVPHFGFLLSAAKGVVGISLPMGIRYKFEVYRNLYVYPMLDLGPSFSFYSGTAGPIGGMLRVGGGISYLVHRNVELVFQPLGLGAGFTANGGAFLYNFLLGAHFRF